MFRPVGTIRLQPRPPAWFEGSPKAWEALSLGARLNLAFQHVHQHCKIPSKEWWENREFFAKVQPAFASYFGHDTVDLVLDAGGGMGLQSLLWLAYGAARRAWVVDRRCPKLYPVLLEAFQEVVEFPEPEYREVRWEEFQPSALPLRTAIVGVHACGLFGERLMERAREWERPFAVLTCCHETPDDLFVAWLKEQARGKGISYFDALDLVRLGRIQGWGWRAWLETINARTSPRNNILLGFPPRL